MKKIKVLQLVFSFRTHELVSGFNLFEEAVRSFPTEQYDVTFATLYGDISESSMASLKCKSHCFGFSKKATKGIRIGTLLTLWRFLKQEQFDLVVTHRYKPSFLTSLVAPFIPNTQFVAVYHNMTALEKKSRQRAARFQWTKQWRVAGVSQAVTKELNRAGIPSTKLITLYNAVDFKDMQQHQMTKAEAQKVLGCDADAFVFGTVGRLKTVKGQSVLVEAFAHVLQHKPGSQLIIIGDGPLAPKLVAQCENLNISKHVVLAGKVPNAYQYMAGFDCFVLPSLSEGLGMVLLESIAAKTPIIGTNIGGIPEIIEEQEWLVGANDPIQLGEAMLRMANLTEIERTELIDTMYQRISNKFSVERYHQNYRNLLIR